MNPETKNCQNCKQGFTIESDDFAFYEKIKVPAPTFCSQCRIQRRMAWRNGWHIFKRKEDREGKDVFSLFPQESPVKVYERDFWWSDGWDAMPYAKEYDFSKPFFNQLHELLSVVPLPQGSIINFVNCRYCTNGADLKNCYFVRAATFTEDSSYVIWDTKSRHCLDSHMTKNCELGYGNINCENCYQTFFSVDCSDCQETILSKDCIGCNNVFGCVGLRRASYQIFNQQYTKEEYDKKLQEFDIASWKNFENLRQQADDTWRTFPHKYMHGLHNLSSSGDYIYDSKNAQFGYRARGVENGKWVQNIIDGPVKDCYDQTSFGEGVELGYETLIAGRGAFNVKFSVNVYTNVKDISYSFFCHSSSNLFACVGLRNKQYCILNQQYTKEEYERLVPKVIEHMNAMPYIDKKGRVYKYGEFFPLEMSYFPYNISEANEFFPLSEEKIKEEGFQSFSVDTQEHQFTKASADLPDNIKDVDEKITEEVIECAHQKKCDQECTGAFRVIPSEVSFLKRMNLPLPRLCPNCRQYERLKQRNPLKLWHRQCMCSKNHPQHAGNCLNEFETSYSPDRPEIIYCEACYQNEVV